MKNHIKKDMFNLEEKFPFSSTDYFEFFKYSRHRDFLRYLDQPKFYKHLIYNEFEKVKTRSAECVSIDRTLFIKICKHRKIQTKEIEKLYFQYKTKKVKKSTEYFPDLKKKDPHTLKMYDRPAGRYYSHSLNTINLAEALDLCPFEVYKYCVTELPYGHGGFKGDIGNKFFTNMDTSIPFLIYDNQNIDYAHNYLSLIKIFISQYNLTSMQLDLANHYCDCIKNLINKIYQIKHKRQFYRENTLKNQEAKALIKSKKQLKEVYRQGAKLFHPDKNPEGLELFKKFSNHYNKLELTSMKRMIVEFSMIKR